MKKLSIPCLALLLLAFACGEENPANLDQSETTDLSETTDQSQAMSFSARSSDCGGFVSGTGGGEPPAAYCDAEALYWSYDAASGELSLRNTRVMLNCCGEHRVEMSFGAQMVMLELDDIPEQGERCRCTCGFDFEATVENVVAGTVSFELARHVEEGQQELLWTGELDLSQGSGVEIIDNEAQPSCSVGP